MVEQGRDEMGRVGLGDVEGVSGGLIINQVHCSHLGRCHGNNTLDPHCPCGRYFSMET